MGSIHQITIENTRIALIQGDITRQKTQAIVNAANSSLMGGGGVDGAIHRAGGPLVMEECSKIISQIGHLETGKAAITTGGNLAAKYIIHTVGPVWHGGNRGEPALLTSAYQECLKLATAYKLESISFPSISTGAYRYPLSDAANNALNTVAAYLNNSVTQLQEVYFVLFDGNSYLAYSNVLSKLSTIEK